ncbi:dTDP-glucose 4,6-dehydratase [Candidatus Pacearchaeota archaeon]|nr:dTDP-glucose 4,6-dehydratase [Candidatus Pacearchaeota archaeon]
MKILVTGGSGFIGSNFINNLLEKGNQIVNLDKLTYAAKGKNLEHMGISENSNYKFALGDICDKYLVNSLFKEEKPDMVFNFAAESHVDRSLKNPDDFIKTNILGAVNIFEASLKNKTKRIIHISTDEVYGSRNKGSFSEDSSLTPSSPYSASKASADLIALSFYKSFNLPVIVTRSANNYGEYQFPEKFIPLFITNLIEEKKVPLMWSKENPGKNTRDWINVKDNCEAIWYAAINGKEGEIYNIPGNNERTNIDITNLLLKEFGYGDEMIEKISHRNAHDFRYSINGDKILQLGFEYKYKNLEKELNSLIRWYQENKSWWEPLKK